MESQVLTNALSVRAASEGMIDWVRTRSEEQIHIHTQRRTHTHIHKYCSPQVWAGTDVSSVHAALVCKDLPSPHVMHTLVEESVSVYAHVHI